MKSFVKIPVIKFNNLKANLVFIFIIVNIILAISPTIAQLSHATLKISEVNVGCHEPGDDVSVPIILENISPGSLIVSFQFTVIFDENYISWKGTQQNPGTGIVNINPSLTPIGDDWIWISQPGQLSCLWIDQTYNGVLLSNDEVFFDLVFVYKGMPIFINSPISWSTFIYPTEMINQFFEGFNLTLNDGEIYTGSCHTSLSLKASLEGPYNNGLLQTSLNNAGFLPLQQPFDSPPWNYCGFENVPSYSNSNIVDWVLVELRKSSGDVTTAASNTCFARQAGFILNTGNIVNVDGEELFFMQGTNKNLYVVIWQRNHLNIISSIPLLKNEQGIYEYDFTDSASKVYGGTLAQKELSTGIWGMISGNGNADTVINYSDKTGHWIPQCGLSGYKTGDYNLDGMVNNQDKNEYWLPNYNRNSFVPD